MSSEYSITGMVLLNFFSKPETMAQASSPLCSEVVQTTCYSGAHVPTIPHMLGLGQPTNPKAADKANDMEGQTQTWQWLPEAHKLSRSSPELGIQDSRIWVLWDFPTLKCCQGYYT